MKIEKIRINESLPIKKFEVNNLSNVVFLAGPNGIGKTRLIQAILNFFRNPQIQPNFDFLIRATSKYEKELWQGKDNLCLSDPNDINLFRRTLQRNQTRRNFKSSVLYYESNRQITKIQPLQFTWEFQDPYKENIGWDFSFNPLTGRFQDTLHSLFKKIQSHKTSIANRAIQLKESGKDSMNLNFSDPLQPFKDAFSQMLAPKVLSGVNMQGNSLRIKDGDREINENLLSSGEREVLNIVFDFLLRKPSDCIVFFDEPELHLHPELANKLLNTLKTIGEGNQFIFCTHSAELISSNLDNSVIFIQPYTDNSDNQAITVSLEDDTYDALKAIGQSIGVVSLGKKIVLIEGQQSSLDKKTYLQILKGNFSNLVLVPCEGKYTIQSFSNVAGSVLEKTVWGVEFYLLSDRDAFPRELSDKIKKRNLDSKIRTLSKYHLENYFLDEYILAEIFSDMEDDDSWLRNPEKIKNVLKEIAAERISYSTALSVSKLLRDSVGNIDTMVKGCDKADCKGLMDLFSTSAQREIARIKAILAEENIRKKIESYYEEFTLSLTTDDWKNEIPGKQIFKIFCSKARMDEDRLKTLYIQKTINKSNGPFDEIFNIFKSFSEA